MIELGWSAPARRVDAGTARRGILWQHQRIRVLLEHGRVVAEAALDGEATSDDAVASAVGDIRSIFEIHLSFEETVLLPRCSATIFRLGRSARIVCSTNTRASGRRSRRCTTKRARTPSCRCWRRSWRS